MRNDWVVKELNLSSPPHLFHDNRFTGGREDHNPVSLCLKLSVEGVGIEPTSSVLQTDAMTTSANPPIDETPNLKNQISTNASVIGIWNLVLGISARVPRGGFEPSVAGVKGRHPDR